MVVTEFRLSVGEGGDPNRLVDQKKDFVDEVEGERDGGPAD